MELKDIKGIGDKMIAKLKELGIISIEGLINFIPKSYIDMGKIMKISDATEGEYCVVAVEIQEIKPTVFIKSKLNYFKAVGFSGEHKVELTWFNMPYIRNNLQTGKFIVCGKLGVFKGIYSFTNPKFESGDTATKLKGISPIYPLKGIISQSIFAKILLNALETYDYQSVFDKLFEKKCISDKNFINYKTALFKAHNPVDMQDVRLSHYTLALKEIALDLVGYRMSRQEAPAKDIAREISNYKRYLNLIPFVLTTTQSVALDEIINDLSNKKPMNRLLLGDVGSGKTVLALIAMACVCECNEQCVIMAPTEILCNQHYNTILNSKITKGLIVRKLSSSTPKAERELLLKELKCGKCDILVSTHSCLSEEVKFANLGFVVIDELHKFGVKQRRLLEKNKNVDVLVMSATPLPRTLAMVMYGDLTLSEIKRRAEIVDNIKTYIFSSKKIIGMYGYLEKKVKIGEQCYLVCPRFENAEGEELYSAKGIYEDIKKNISKDIKLKLLYGAIKDNEKNEIMDDFKSKKIDILVSTTVIEVGIDVPNANTIVIMAADKLGLASLHQLRGRVGRGIEKGECFLHTRKEEIPERLKAMLQCNDGIELSEIDAKLRGYGDIIGIRQSGSNKYDCFALKITLDMIKRAKLLADSVDINDTNIVNALKNRYDMDSVTLN